MSTSLRLPTPSSISLIITDVDGTLLTSSHKIHSRTLSAFKALRKKYPTLPIVIASGKQYESCRWIRDVLGLDELINEQEKEGMERFPAIHCNGSLVYAGGSIPTASSTNGSTHLPPPPIISKHLLSPSTVLHLISETKAYGTFLFTPTDAILVNKGERIHRKDWCEIAGRYDSNVIDRTEEGREDVLRMAGTGELGIVKVTVCVDECEQDGKSLFLFLTKLTHSN